MFQGLCVTIGMFQGQCFRDVSGAVLYGCFRGGVLLRGCVRGVLQGFFGGCVLPWGCLIGRALGMLQGACFMDVLGAVFYLRDVSGARALGIFQGSCFSDV